MHGHYADPFYGDGGSSPLRTRCYTGRYDFDSRAIEAQDQTLGAAILFLTDRQRADLSLAQQHNTSLTSTATTAVEDAVHDEPHRRTRE